MRFLELDLIAFGPFTQHRIDLTRGQHGLHLIYGPNEAGKSSSLRAITDFLFEYPQQTPDSFIHVYKQLRIGATLQHSNGAVLKAIRRKAKLSLREMDDETVIDEGALGSFLGEVDRDFFNAMFGINHERLRQGGQEIARGKGRLGELLFAAGAGLAGLQSVQQDLNSDIDRLFSPSGRSGQICLGLRELQDSKKQVTQSQVSVESWKQHQLVLSEAQHRKHQLDRRISKVRAELERLTRIHDAMTAIAIWKSQREKCLVMQDIPRLDVDFLSRSAKLTTDFRKAELQQLSLAEAIDGAQKKFKLIESNKQLFTESELIDGLRAGLGEYQKAKADRPGLFGKKELIENEMHDLLRKLGLPMALCDIENLRIPADRKVRISELGVGIERLNERLKSDRKVVQKLQLQISQAAADFNQLPQPQDLSQLKSRLKSVREQGDLEGILEDRVNEHQRILSLTSRAAARLPYWQGTIAELGRQSISNFATIDRFEQDLNSAASKVQSFEQQQDRELETINGIDHQLSTLESERSIPTQVELDRCRLLRDRGWSLLRDEWKSRTQAGNLGVVADQSPDQSANRQTIFLKEAASSEGFDETVQKLIQAADQIADRMRFEAETVALKGKLLADRKRSERNLKKYETSRAAAIETLKQIEGDWSNLWKACGIEAHSPNEMSDWLRQYESLVNEHSQLQDVQAQIEKLEVKIRLSRDSLMESVDAEMRSCCEGLSLLELTDRLIELHEQNHQRVNERERRSSALKTDRSELEEAKSELQRTQQELADLATNWKLEMNFLGLQGDTLVAQANARIGMIEQIFEQKRTADNFATRIKHIDRDTQDYEIEIATLAQRNLPESTGKLPMEQLQLLIKGLDIARDASRQKLELRATIEESSARLEEVNQTAAAAKLEIRELMRQAGANEIEDLNDAALRSFDRLKEEEKLNDAERQIAGFSNGRSIDEFIAEAEAERDQAETLSTRIDQLKLDIDAGGESRDQVLSQIRSAEIELDKFNGNCLAAEKNGLVESTVAKLDEQIQSLAILKMASAVLNRGIELHREKNQGPVLSRASQLFSTMTLERYSGLRVDFNDRGEPIVLGVRTTAAPEKQLVAVEGMSEGTCDQLYLALRLASLELWLQHHEPLPFIVDDILMNFDDDRALATLQVLAKLSEQTQVIFFTHHQHLIDLAERQPSLQNVFVSRIQSKAEINRLSGQLF